MPATPALDAAGKDADANAGQGNVGDPVSTCSADQPLADIAVHVQTADGNPLKDVTVSVDGQGWAGVTDGNGDFDFGEHPAGTYTVTGQKDCFQTQTTPSQFAPAGATTPYQLVLQSSLSVTKIQYKVKGSWKDVPSPLGPLCPGSSVEFKAIIAPDGTSCPKTPNWGGDASGTTEEVKVTFGSSGARTVSVECGNKIQIDVNVAGPNNSVAITWNHGYTVDNATADATTKERRFVADYEACADVVANVWHLRVKSTQGGTDMAVHMGGFKTPQPGVNITTQAQAAAAINDMLREGAAGGPASTWVTEDAIKGHEGWHRDEWVQTCEHYWPDTETALEKLTVPYDTNENNMANAVTAMRAGSSGADAKVTAFKQVSRNYWFTLSDSPGSRPYQAGGAVLNAQITAVRNFGATQTPPWVLPAGTNTAPPADHCYQPWLPYSP